MERGNEPFRGQLALPGGFVRTDEGLDAAAGRELAEETGISGTHLHLEQLHTYADPDRDPRGRVVTVAYLAIKAFLPEPSAGTDATDAHWRPVEPLLTDGGLAFDHDAILAAAVERARTRLEYTTVATAFCPDRFTIGDLRQVYEVAWGRPVDHRNFHRKVLSTDGFLVPTGEQRIAGTGRPANLYRPVPATVLFPPMLRTRADGG